MIKYITSAVLVSADILKQFEQQQISGEKLYLLYFKD